MRITVLIENTCKRSDLNAEHGLSLFIETGGLRILFDTGASRAFADNAAQLGIDLRSVDMAILSHGHYDHGGGIARFLELNFHAPSGSARMPSSRISMPRGKTSGCPPR